MKIVNSIKSGVFSVTMRSVVVFRILECLERGKSQHWYSQLRNYYYVVIYHTHTYTHTAFAIILYLCVGGGWTFAVWHGSTRIVVTSHLFMLLLQWVLILFVTWCVAVLWKLWNWQYLCIYVIMWHYNKSFACVRMCVRWGYKLTDMWQLGFLYVLTCDNLMKDNILK